MIFYNPITSQFYTVEGLYQCGAIRAKDNYSIDELKSRNYYPVVDDKPTYNADFSQLEATTFDFDEETKTPTQHYKVVNFDLDTAKTNLKAHVTQIRWDIETSGISMAGFSVLTGIADQNRIATICLSAVSAKVKGKEFAPVKFKTSDGTWVELDGETLITVGEAVTAHVEACFLREQELHTEIDACTTLKQLKAIDIESGWNTQPNEESTETTDSAETETAETNNAE